MSGGNAPPARPSLHSANPKDKREQIRPLAGCVASGGDPSGWRVLSCIESSRASAWNWPTRSRQRVDACSSRWSAFGTNGRNIRSKGPQGGNRGAAPYRKVGATTRRAAASSVSKTSLSLLLLLLHLHVAPIHLVGFVTSLGRELDHFFRQKKLATFAGL